MSGLVLVLEDDLLFASRVEVGLKAVGYQARFVTELVDFAFALKTAPVLILVDIGSQAVPWPDMVALARERRSVPRPKILGVGPHGGLEARDFRGGVAMNPLDFKGFAMVWQDPRIER